MSRWLVVCLLLSSCAPEQHNKAVEHGPWEQETILYMHCSVLCWTGKRPLTKQEWEQSHSPLQIITQEHTK